MTEQSFSQHKQDVLLDKLVFKGKTNGVFIEIGAYDGIKFSNAYFFEKYRHWTGICVEPIKKRFDELVKNRTAICENAAIDTHEHTLQFTWAEGDFETEMLSGVAHDEKNQQRILKNIKEGTNTLSTIEVQAVPLKKLLAKHQITKADYCSIDVEGHEISVLKSIDFSAVDIRVFTIEMNHSFAACEKLMMQKGYKFLQTMGPDAVFEKARFALTPYLTIGVKRIIKKILRLFNKKWFAYLGNK